MRRSSRRKRLESSDVALEGGPSRCGRGDPGPQATTASAQLSALNIEEEGALKEAVDVYDAALVRAARLPGQLHQKRSSRSVIGSAACLPIE